MSQQPDRAATPPRFATRLLSALLSDAHRDAVLGDLEEDFARDPSRLRYWRQSLAALVHLRPRVPRPVRRPAHQESRVTSFVADLRLALRLLRRAPSFTAVCALTLGLAIGASAAIFSVADPLLLRPVPYPQGDRLVFLLERDADGGESNMGFATFADLVKESRTIERAAAIGSWQPTIAERGPAGTP